MKNDPIGILDSGVGGLSVFLEIKKLLPNESILYVADSKNVPFSEKKDSEIFDLAVRMIQFLHSKGAKLIVVACNTITVSAIDKLRVQFPVIPIVGTVPVVKTAASLTKKRKVGIFSTKKTAESTYQKDLIKEFAKDVTVLNLGSNTIAPTIEKGETGNGFTRLLREELKPFKDAGVDVLALGCTHYPLVRAQIKAIMGKGVLVVDSGPAIARQVKRVLLANNALSEDSSSVYTFYTSGSKRQLAKTVSGIGVEGQVKRYE